MSKLAGVNEDLLDRLAANAAPVRRVDSRRFLALLTLATLASLAVIVGFPGTRADLASGLSNPMFLWKFGAMASVALLSVPMLLASGRPGAGKSRIELAAITGLIVFGAPFLFAMFTQAPSQTINGFDTTRGFGCLKWTTLASLPVWLASIAWLRQSAPTNLVRASWSAGIASASVGGTCFALHCPYDDIAYVSVWYGAAILMIAAVTRIVLPRLIRW